MSAIDPLNYHGPCEPCRHFAARDMAICHDCLTPSATGHNGQYRFEPINAFPEMTAELRFHAAREARWAAEEAAAELARAA